MGEYLVNRSYVECVLSRIHSYNETALEQEKKIVSYGAKMFLFGYGATFIFFLMKIQRSVA